MPRPSGNETIYNRGELKGSKKWSGVAGRVGMINDVLLGKLSLQAYTKQKKLVNNLLKHFIEKRNMR